MSNWIDDPVFGQISVAVDSEMAKAIHEAQYACSAIGESAAVALRAFPGERWESAINGNALSDACSGLEVASVVTALGSAGLPGENLFIARDAINDLVLTRKRTSSGCHNPDETKTPEASKPVEKRRGRPIKMPDELKDKAQAIKNAGGTDRDAAMILYATAAPTLRQVKDAASLLSRHRKKRAGIMKSAVDPTE